MLWVSYQLVKLMAHLHLYLLPLSFLSPFFWYISWGPRGVNVPVGDHLCSMSSYLMIVSPFTHQVIKFWDSEWGFSLPQSSYCPVIHQLWHGAFHHFAGKQIQRRARKANESLNGLLVLLCFVLIQSWEKSFESLSCLLRLDFRERKWDLNSKNLMA